MEINNKIIELLKAEVNYNVKQIKAVLELLDAGNTVPFIARYRKEQTNSLDEVQIREIESKYHYLANLEEQKEQVLTKIKEQDKLTPELEKAILQTTKLAELEDLYRPYKQKRRTKATIARERGLEPVAQAILQAKDYTEKLELTSFLTEELQTTEDILAGALEIIAETISDKAKYRKFSYEYLRKNASLQTSLRKDANDEKEIYQMYYDYSEAVKVIPNHRVLAINRGEKEKVLKVKVNYEQEKIFEFIAKDLKLNQINNENQQELLKTAIEEALKRFILPAIERKIRVELTEIAEKQAIEVFGENLRQLLLQAPLKNKIVLGLDPAYRTGCKLAVVDQTGKLLAVDVIYPTASTKQNIAEASTKFQQLINEYNVTMVAIGNGTASRESEQFVSEEIKKTKRSDLYYTIVSEAGASVYSASAEARAEFPDLQVEQRSAVSIARRLQDPLAELIKIDPKSVGVGQYQHDVSQKQLNEQLDFVVDTAVNQVGVDLNTASVALLKHISGLTKTTANNIVQYREENGAFTSRQELKQVPRLGPKSYEQAIGFLRIPEGKYILDNTDIHPESYQSAEAILNYLNIEIKDLTAPASKEKLQAANYEIVARDLGLGKETTKDILSSLQKPGRDMRESMPKPILRQDVLQMEDLKVGMELQGTVRNIVDFGAFVDIGVKQDGLVHLSKMSTNYVKHPSQIVAVGDIVTVWVEEVDLKRGRISLTMIQK